MNNVCVVTLLFMVALLSCDKPRPAVLDSVGPPLRVVSFAPSVTEILYELGVGESVVGVTRFCGYPVAAREKETVGAHASFNYESVIRLKPDLAVILKEQRELVDFFDKYGIRYAAVGNGSVDEILESILKIADACHVKEAGDSIVQNLRRRMEAVSTSTPANGRPKVLVCVDRSNIGSGVVSQCFAAGARSFYNQLITMAGGANVLEDGQAYPQISIEAVIRLDPDIIIDLSSAYSADHDPQSTCGDWSALKNVSAVKTGKVHCLQGDYLTIPGPRFVKILESFCSVII